MVRFNVTIKTLLVLSVLILVTISYTTDALRDLSITSPDYFVSLPGIFAKSKLSVDLPDVESGTEKLDNGFKYSNSSGIILSTEPKITCDWKAPEDDDGWKICEAIFELENQKDSKEILTHPKLELIFKDSKNVRNLEIQYSNDYSIQEVEHLTEEITSLIEKESSGKFSTQSVPNHNKKISQLSKKNALSVSKVDETEFNKRQFRNFRDLSYFEEEEVIVESSTDSDSNESQEESSLNESDDESLEENLNISGINETVSLNESEETPEDALNLSDSNETISENLEENSTTLEETPAESEENSEEPAPEENLEEETPAAESNSEEPAPEENPEEDHSILPLQGAVIKTGYAILEEERETRLDTNHPLAIKVTFEIPKYESNNFDFKISEGSFEGFIDPEISACGVLNNSNSIYTIDREVSATGSCFNITAQNVTLDCQGNTISFGSTNSNSYGVYSSEDETTVTNCTFVSANASNNNLKAIHLSGSDDSVISSNNVTMITDYSYGIYLDSDSSDTTIEDNTVLQTGDSTYAIYLDSTNDLTIADNVLDNSGPTGLGLYITSSDNITITGNDIETEGESGYGIFMVGGIDNNISGNTVVTGESDAISVGLESESDLILSNNNLTANGEETPVINTINLEDSQIFLNNVTSSSPYSQGILLDYSSQGNNVSFNVINLSGDSEVSTIYLSSASSNIISYNNATLNGGRDSHCIVLEQGSNSNTLKGNNLRILALRDSGIYLDSVTSATLEDNIINLTDDNSKGIYQNSGGNHTTNNNHIYLSGRYGSGIYISGSQNLTTYQSDEIILLGDSSNAVLFQSNNAPVRMLEMSLEASGSGSNAIQINGSSNISLEDFSLQAGGYDFIANSLASGIWNLTNVSINSSDWDSTSGILNKFWKLSVSASTSSGNPISAFNLTILDNDSTQTYGNPSVNDNVSVTLKEYTQNSSSDKTFFSNYLVLAEYDNSSQNSSVNISENKAIYFTFQVDDSEESPSSPETPASSGGSTSSSGTASQESENASCSSSWKCSAWNDCSNGTQTRTCIDSSGCNKRSPPTEKSCKSSNERDTLFDILLEVLDSTPGNEEKLSASIGLINVGIPGRVKSDVIYTIEDSRGNVVLMEEETVPVETQTEFLKKFNISSLDRGKYSLSVFLTYEGQVEPATAQETFYVGYGLKFFLLDSLKIILLIFGPLMIVLFLVPRVFRFGSKNKESGKIELAMDVIKTKMN